MTDPSYARQLITFTYPHIGNYGVSAAAMESDRIHARAAIMRDARNHSDSAGAEGGWLDWLRDHGVAGDHRRRHARARAPHPRRRRDARRRLPRRTSRSRRRGRADRGRAVDGRASTSSREVTPRGAVELEPTGGRGDGPTIALIDTGVKTLDPRAPARARRAAARAPVHGQRRARSSPAHPTA